MGLWWSSRHTNNHQLGVFVGEKLVILSKTVIFPILQAFALKLSNFKFFIFRFQIGWRAVTFFVLAFRVQLLLFWLILQNLAVFDFVQSRVKSSYLGGFGVFLIHQFCAIVRVCISLLAFFSASWRLLICLFSKI